MRAVTTFEIYKKTKNPGGVAYPGESWDGPWKTQREAERVLSDRYQNDPAFRIVKITIQPLS